MSADATTHTLVYILDDDEELSESLAWLLESVGIRSERFQDARAFLRSYDRDRPACLILDVRMPELSGFDVQQLLNETGAPLPVVFVSAHGDIRMSVRAMQNGAVDFLEKPYDPQHMLDVVQAALRTARERFERAAVESDLRAKLDGLTSREREVLGLAVDGMANKQIATRLGISAKTIDVHRARIREKTGAQSMATLVRDVLRLGLRPAADR
ncbi:response regulator transcription factor [Streptomyces botrytidirepellens]|uniref:DNA-binding response regulator n=1 Tax=Streptomyces botrytidirepellens TaxID=2486417 RepID=A0A3M8X7M2_9ACTN|nr:response regulator [Streptomyces botrytidirepellens]RNG38382.1 DNA-binding response regulator [Streptomyces botrytidirepellens]